MHPRGSSNELQLLTSIQAVALDWRWSAVKPFEMRLAWASALSSNCRAAPISSHWAALFANIDTALECTEQPHIADKCLYFKFILWALKAH